MGGSLKQEKPIREKQSKGPISKVQMNARLFSILEPLALLTVPAARSLFAQ